MKYNRVCEEDCVAYDEPSGGCSLLMSVKQMAQSLQTLAGASGLLSQSIEASWHNK